MAEAYLRNRGISAQQSERWLRYHPRCWYRPSEDDQPGTPNAFPALIAAVTDNEGTITGVHRTWLDVATRAKADVATPRRAMGDLLGLGVRFGGNGPIMAGGEGIETILSLRTVMSSMPMIAGLSAPHLAAIIFPTELRRLYVARDSDPAGDVAWATMSVRAVAAGIEIVPLLPLMGDFNDDLHQLGADCLRANLQAQLHPDDIRAFLPFDR